jgi:hypothetical protein
MRPGRVLIEGNDTLAKLVCDAMRKDPMFEDVTLKAGFMQYREVK